MMYFRLVAIVAVIFVLLPALALAQDPGERDTVRVGHVEVNAGELAGVPVELFNDENVSAYSFGLTWNSPDIIVDSISYVGARELLPGQVTIFTPDNPNQTVLVGLVDITGFAPFPPGDGLIFTIWFDVPPGTPDQFVDIDSTFLPPAATFILSPQGGGSITPEFFMGQIKIGDPQPPPIIVLDETEFVFDALVGDPDPPAQILNISNGGGQTLDWEASWDATWLTVSPNMGTAPSAVSISVSGSGLSAGTYIDTVEISDAGATNSPQYVAVTFDLAVPPPTIELVPDSFYFQVLADSANPSGQDMEINNIGAGVLNWTAVHDATWLSLSSYGGTAPSLVTISVDNSGLSAGVYIDSIEISDPTAVNSPQNAIVVFEIFSAFPVLEVEPDSIYAAGSATVDPYDRVLRIFNGGGGVMNWSLSTTASHISFDIDTGSAVQGTPAEVVVSFNGSGMDFGKHWDDITVTSSNATNSPVIVEVTYFKMEVPQFLSVSTNNLDFTEYECGSIPGVDSKSFVITAEEVAPPLNWTISFNEPWLSVSPLTGYNGGIVIVTVDVDGLAPGIYLDTITVKSDVAVNPPEKIAVSFTVVETPPDKELKLSITNLTYLFKAHLVGTADRTVIVFNLLGGCLDWSATATVPWLEPIPVSGTTVSELLVRSDATELPLGMHEGQVIVTAPEASNSPQTIDVELWVWTFGDANADGIVDVTDVVYILSWIFIPGSPAPIPVPRAGDVNCDRLTDVSDVVYLLNWLFNYGPDPCLY